MKAWVCFHHSNLSHTLFPCSQQSASRISATGQQQGVTARPPAPPPHAGSSSSDPQSASDLDRELAQAKERLRQIQAQREALRDGAAGGAAAVAATGVQRAVSMRDDPQGRVQWQADQPHKVGDDAGVCRETGPEKFSRWEE